MRWILRAIVAAWSMAEDQSAQPRPDDCPRVKIAGPTAVRVLLIGSGVAVGSGVFSHELALPGALARALATRTGRGAEVQVHANPFLTARSIRKAAEEFDLTGVDALVVSVGVNEALSLEPPAAWERSLARVVDVYRRQAAISGPIVLLGIPEVGSFYLEGVAGRIVGRHAVRLNRGTFWSSHTMQRVNFVSLGGAEIEDRQVSRVCYEMWGNRVADELAGQLSNDLD